MKPLASLRSLVSILFHRCRIDSEMDEELSAHIQDRADDLERSGLSRAEAQRRARLDFGGYQKFKEECHEALGSHFLETFLQDVRYAIRMLTKSPGFTTVAALTLALGIGANAALFSVVNGVLLNPLPYPQSEQLVSLRQKTVDAQERPLSYPNFVDYERDNRTFTAIAGYRQEDFSLTGEGEPERLRGEMTSASFFPLLGVKPVIGRVFSAEEDLLGGRPVTIISAGFWGRKFAFSPEIVGRTVTLSGTNYTIVGAIPAGFHLDRDNDVYIPLGQWRDQASRDRRISAMEVVGRLKRGVGLGQARADMEAIARNLGATYPDANRNEGIALTPLKKDIVGDVQPFLLLLLGAVGFVLLIACANVANLLLARSTGRTLEFAVRTALGAGRPRVIRQLLTESVVLAISGGALGLLLASWGTRSMLAALPAALPRSDEVRVDPSVLIFALMISILVGIAFGMAPALKASNPDLHETLKQTGRGSSGARHRLQSIFIGAEIALALVLLIGAGLMIRSLAKLGSVNPGFNPHNVLTFSLSLPAAISASPNKTRAYLRELADKLDAIPGVEASSVSASGLPLSGDFGVFPFWLEGQPKPASQSDMKAALFYPVGPGYFKALGIPLKSGRLLSSRDDEHSPFVVVIDEMLAREYFDNQDPIGKRMNLGLDFPQAEIVGVVGHVKHFSLDSSAGPPFQAQLYFPFAQFPDKHMPHFAATTTFVVRTQDAPLALVSSVRTAIEQMNGEQVMYDEHTMDQVVSNSLAARRFSMILLDFFAAFAVALASVGIYGVVFYLVGQRTHEIGIRTTLGALPKDVLKLVLGQSAKIVFEGVAAGLAGAFALTRLMASLLYGISATDPLTFAGVAVLLTLVALAACYVPARRAPRVDPIVALRCE